MPSRCLNPSLGTHGTPVWLIETIVCWAGSSFDWYSSLQGHVGAGRMASRWRATGDRGAGAAQVVLWRDSPTGSASRAATSTRRQPSRLVSSELECVRSGPADRSSTPRYSADPFIRRSPTCGVVTRANESDRFVDETYVRVSGVWSCVYWAVDQHGQVIDVYVSNRRDIASARTFFTAALSIPGDPAEVVTDRGPALANVIEELVPAAWHNTVQYQNNRVECDHSRLKTRLRPMRGLKTHRTASVVIRGHAFIQNLRRGPYELAIDNTPLFWLATALDELRPAI